MPQRSLLILSLLLGLTSRTALAAVEAPPGYTMTKKNDVGRILTVSKDQAATVRDALKLVLDDLDDYFDDDYTVSGAFEDQRDHRTGFCIFSAKYAGQPVRGFVNASLKDKGAAAVVIFCQTTAPPTAWKDLSGTATAAKNDSPAAATDTSATLPTLTTYRFPDGTGEVGLADGWSTQAQSCHTGFMMQGPHHSHIAMGIGFSINTPNSMAVQLARQYGTGGQPMLVAPFTNPTDAMANILPQLQRINAQKGLPAAEIDSVRLAKPLPSLGSGNQMAMVSYGVTKKDPKEHGHYTALSEVSITPITNQSWMLWVIEMATLDSDAKTEMPKMIAMVNSWKKDMQVDQAMTNQNIAAQKDWFAAQQAAHKEITDAYDQQHEDWRKNQNLQSRSNDNADEVLRGVRDLYDSKSGEMQSVDLGKIDDVQAALNQSDPGRYVQIPLRDKMDPLTGR